MAPPCFVYAYLLIMLSGIWTSILWSGVQLRCNGEVAEEGPGEVEGLVGKELQVKHY